MKIERLLAKYLVGLKYEEIPSGVIEATKLQILNIISAMLGGSATGGIKELVELLRDWGGKQESTVFAYGYKIPAPNAAQANASMGHALDFDDTYNKVMLHPAVVSVPPALAIAEMRPGVSGKEFLTAVALSIDLGCRMCLVVKSPPDGKDQQWWQVWHFTALFGYFMAAAAAGRLLQLNEDEMMNALGLAYHQAAGNGQVVRDGAHAKRLGPGFSCRAGVTSALMAQKGITGARNFIEGEVGLFDLYFPGTPYNLPALTDKLGQQFENEDISLKPYPCGVVNHTAIDAALIITQEYDIKPGDVAEVIIFTGQGSSVLWKPIEMRRHPKNGVETQFSIPWSVATAIAKRRATIQDYTDDAARDPVMHELTSKISAEIDPALTGGSIEPTRVRIKTKGGKEFFRQVDIPLGSPQRPFQQVDIKRKLKDCNSVSIKPLSDENLDKLVATIQRLEDLEDMEQVISTLVRG
jgi:2-methylcitrate dehydratase PrpD